MRSWKMRPGISAPGNRGFAKRTATNFLCARELMGPLALGSYRCNLVARAPSKHPEGRLENDLASGHGSAWKPCKGLPARRQMSCRKERRLELSMSEGCIYAPNTHHDIKRKVSSLLESNFSTRTHLLLRSYRRFLCFLSSHRLVPWTHLHLNLRRTPDVPALFFPLSDLSDSFPPHSHQVPLFPFHLCCFYSRLRYHISSTPRIETVRHRNTVSCRCGTCAHPC
ncbi:hypothetical protein F5144DRAFT_292315 [Chaetomium tenue]|uniref:Uncharacterized protein n=1 Tax=Chaetomium tenue TaxID=1854479 RepID=A0ACB7P4A8_9PEZI|nr:hypothetical protein F5144DRAFT_292315 [Chaetomium globosum]